MVMVSIKCFAQPTIVNVKIENNRSNYLEIVFSENINSSNSDGFRLVGGTSRIESLLGGNGSNTLIFKLSNHVLPDESYSLLHWPELSDAYGNSGKLGEVEVKVDNRVSKFNGPGKIYYISNSGNDSNNGISPSSPKKSLQKTINLCKPGDIVLLKRGDRWEDINRLTFPESGTSSNYITVSAYDKGNKPLIVGSRSDETILIDKDFVKLDNLHIQCRDNLYGLLISGNSERAIISNCKVEAVDRSPSSGRTDHAIFYGKNGTTHPIIINNEVSGARWGISSSGYPYTEKNGKPNHNVYGGLIENNKILNTATSSYSGNDGLQIARGDYHNIIVRKNTITQWSDDGIDTYLGFNIIIEHNTLTNPRNTAANAIKCGGVARGGNENPAGRKSSGIIVRYNTIHDINLKKSNHAINTNDGGDAEIYGNLAYNISGSGCQISGNIDKYEIYNNTFVNCNYGVSCYTTGSNAGEIYLTNNIIEGTSDDVNANTRGTGKFIKGKNNMLLTGETGGSYKGSNDFKDNKSKVFKDYTRNNYKLHENSPARDKGILVGNYLSDLLGGLFDNKIDLGAFEYTDESSTPAPQPSPEPEPEPTPTPEPEEPTGKNGVNYNYYQGEWTNLPDFSKLQAVKSGLVSNFTLSPRNREEYFGFEFSAYIQIDTDGTYTFYTTSDDGSELFINNQKIVDNDGLHGAVEKSGKIFLTKGLHSIEVNYFERTRGQILEVEYAGPGVSKKLIPTAKLFTDKGNATPSPEQPDAEAGLNYKYYHGDWTQLPDFSKLNAYKSGKVNNFNISPRERDNKIAFEYEGYIQIDTEGTYTFYTTSDDGSKLYISSKEIVNNDGLHGPTEKSGNVYLTKGLHPIKVTFFERSSGQLLEVKYAGPGVSKQIIPGSKLYTEKTDSTPEPTPSPEPDEPSIEAGLNYKYYEGYWNLMPDFGKLTAKKSGKVNNFSLEPRESEERFGFVYEGYIQIDSDGTYSFYTTSDDGSKLYINSKEIVDNDGVHAAEEVSGKVYLTKGWHPIKVTFFERSHGEVLEVRYAGPGVSKKLIPSNKLASSLNNNARVASSSKSITKNANETQTLKEENIEDSLFPNTGEVLVYPNPVDAYLNIKFDQIYGSVSLKIVDMNGRIVLAQELSNPGFQIQLAVEQYNLPTGKYILSLSSNGQIIKNVNLLKR